jgi:hypothetical protein
MDNFASHSCTLKKFWVLESPHHFLFPITNISREQKLSEIFENFASISRWYHANIWDINFYNLHRFFYLIGSLILATIWPWGRDSRVEEKVYHTQPCHVTA